MKNISGLALCLAISSVSVAQNELQLRNIVGYELETTSSHRLSYFHQVTDDFQLGAEVGVGTYFFVPVASVDAALQAQYQLPKVGWLSPTLAAQLGLTKSLSSEDSLAEPYLNYYGYLKLKNSVALTEKLNLELGSSLHYRQSTLNLASEFGGNWQFSEQWSTTALVHWGWFDLSSDLLADELVWDTQSPAVEWRLSYQF